MRHPPAQDAATRAKIARALDLWDSGKVCAEIAQVLAVEQAVAANYISYGLVTRANERLAQNAKTN
jgi:hypothetical protein